MKGVYFPIDNDDPDTDYIFFDDEKTYAKVDIPPEAFHVATFRIPGYPRIQPIGGYWPVDGSPALFGEQAILATIKEAKNDSSLHK